MAECSSEKELNVFPDLPGAADAVGYTGDLFPHRTVEYDYPSFHLSMDCFWCKLAGDHVVLKEHEAARWLCAQELDDVDWLPADLLLIDEISLILKEG